jgi:phosphoribosylanthranilate isomerase
VADARLSVDAGASAIGVNLVPSSLRCIGRDLARSIVQAVGKDALVVAVVRDLAVAAMLEVTREVGCGCLQLHGNEPPESLEPLLPHAYKAIAVATLEDIEQADRYGGEWVLLDTKTSAGSGGTGQAFDWSLARELAKVRKVILAGGLTAENVAEAVRLVRPDTVDVASGVELPGQPRKKDPHRLRAFVAAVRG